MGHAFSAYRDVTLLCEGKRFEAVRRGRRFWPAGPHSGGKESVACVVRCGQGVSLWDCIAGERKASPVRCARHGRRIWPAGPHSGEKEDAICVVRRGQGASLWDCIAGERNTSLARTAAQVWRKRRNDEKG